MSSVIRLLQYLAASTLLYSIQCEHTNSTTNDIDGSSSSEEPQIAWIVNGDEVSGSDYPWMVALVAYKLNTRRYLSFCGGSLVQQEPVIILTAAHCLTPFRKSGSNLEMLREEKWVPVRLYAQLGRTWTNQGSMNSHELSIEITSMDMMHIHPEWNEKNVHNGHDIAVIMIQSQENEHLLGSNVYPVARLPSVMDPERGCCLNHEMLEVIGYGLDNDKMGHTLGLEHITMMYRNKDECRQFYLELGDSYRPPNRLICVTGDNVDICQGDSGGPLFRTLANGNIELVGITSFLLAGQTEDDYCNTKHLVEDHHRHVVPSMFTSVAHHIAFINEVTDGLMATNVIGLGTGPGNETDEDKLDNFIINLILVCLGIVLLGIVAGGLCWYCESKKKSRPQRVKHEAEGFSDDSNHVARKGLRDEEERTNDCTNDDTWSEDGSYNHQIR